MKLEKSELIYIASIVVGKDYSYEDMAYSGEYLGGNKDMGVCRRAKRLRKNSFL